MRLLALILVLISIGCRPLKNLSPETYRIDPITENNLTILNGQYNTLQDTVFGKIEHFPGTGMDDNDKSLLDPLFVFLPNKAYEKETIVEIEVTSQKNMAVRGYQNGTIIFSKNVRGKVKKGYFYVRPKICIIPFFPVIYVHYFEKVRIGKIENDIILDHTIRSWGFALFAGGSDLGRSTSIYKVLNK